MVQSHISSLYPSVAYIGTVWIVSNEQLLAWVQNPVPVSQLGNVDALKCSTPQVDTSKQICNGIPQNEKGLLDLCDFSDFPFYTCVSVVMLSSHDYVNLVCVVRMPSGDPFAFEPEPIPVGRCWRTSSFPLYVRTYLVVLEF